MTLARSDKPSAARATVLSYPSLKAFLWETLWRRIATSFCS